MTKWLFLSQYKYNKDVCSDGKMNFPFTILFSYLDIKRNVWRAVDI